MCERCMLALSIQLSVLRQGWYVVINGTPSVFFLLFCEFQPRMGRSEVIFERCEVGVSMWPYEGDVIDETFP